jgi:hypothetical protein
VTPSLTPPRPHTLAQSMGGGPKFPSTPFSTANMHRAPAAMVTKPMTNPDVEIKTPRDPNTLSNYHNYVARHTSVDFEIDFEKKRLVGSVVLRMESLVDEEGVDVVLDSRYVQDPATSRCLDERRNIGRPNWMSGLVVSGIYANVSQFP